MGKQEAIIQLHCVGRTNSEIIKSLKVAKSTVYHVANIFKQLGTSKDQLGVEDHTLLDQKRMSNLFEKG